MHEVIKHSKRVSCLDEYFGIYRDGIESMSFQTGFDFLSCGWLVRPFCGVPLGLQTHVLHGMVRHPGAVQSLQNRFDCTYSRSLKDLLFEATVSQDLPRQLDKIEYPEPFQG